MDSQIIRRIPRLMMSAQEIAEFDREQDQQTKAVTATVGPAKETGFVNDNEGVCPICHETMKLSVANGVDVYTCVPHRIAMPIRNEGQ